MPLTKKTPRVEYRRKNAVGFTTVALAIALFARCATAPANDTVAHTAATYRGQSIERDDLEKFSERLTEAWSTEGLDWYAEYFGFPGGDHAEYVATVFPSGQYRIFLLRVRSKMRRSIGRVLIVHGYMAHAGHHAPTTTALIDAGYDVYLVDLPGHGLSSGEPNTIRAFSEYGDLVRDTLARIAETEPLAVPTYAIGHSTGASALVEFVRSEPEHASTLSALVFAAPLVRLVSHPFRAWFVRAFLRRPLRVPIGFPMSKGNIRNPEFREFVQTGDPLLHATFDPEWVLALDDWVSTVESAEEPLWGGPTLIVQGSADSVVEWKHNVQVLEHLFPRAVTRVFPRYPHTIINEAPEHLAPVLDTIIGFLARSGGTVPMGHE